jgi:hypothetical protein
VKNASKLKDGAVLVESVKLTKQTLVGYCSVITESYPTLNKGRGIIYSSDMDDCTKNEVQNGLGDQYVARAFRVHKKS